MSTALSPTLPRRILNQWDTAFGFLFILLGLAGLRFVNDGGLWNRWVSGETAGVAVGTVKRLQGEVRMRSASSFAWRDLEDKQTTDAAGGDAVFTGADATAEVSLKDGATATIAPQSLIVLQVSRNGKDWWGDFLGTERDPSVVEVETGSVSLRLDQPGKKVKVRIKNKVFEVTAPQGTAQLSLSKTQVTLVNGSAVQIQELGTTKTTTALTGAGSALLLDKNGQVTSAQEWMSVLTPMQGHSVTLSPGQKLALQWQVLKPRSQIMFDWRPVDSSGKPGESVSTSVSTAVGVAKIEKEIPHHHSHYQWRLTGTDAGGVTTQSQWTDVWIAKLEPPRIIGPADRARLRDRVALRWETTAPTLQPEVEVAPLDASASALTKTNVLPGLRTGLELNLAPGTYLWRARTRDPKGRTSDWSAQRSLVVAPWDRGGSAKAETPQIIQATPVAKVAPAVPKAPKPPKPAVVPAAPVAQIEILPTLENAEAAANTRLGSQMILDRINVTLAWRALPGASDYTVSIFQSDGKLVKTGKVNTPKFVVELRSLQENAYSYQVATTLPNGKVITSRKAPIRVMLSPPFTRMPLKGKVVRAEAAVLMTWEKTAITERYELQIAADPEFRSLVVTQGQKSNFYRYTPGTQRGLLYWRVKSVSGKRESPWSEPAHFIVQGQ